MARTKRHRRGRVEIPSSSLADIAFLLLIFFLVCTTINTESGLQMILPGMNEVPFAPRTFAIFWSTQKVM
ncbi:MAG: ExbD/TolR family protein [Calditrichia bacterium]